VISKECILTPRYFIEIDASCKTIDNLIYNVLLLNTKALAGISILVYRFPIKETQLFVEVEMATITRITFDSKVMGGKPCIRGMRETVGTIVGLVASGHSKEDILRLYPYLEPEDIDEALTYAAWRVEEIDVPVVWESA